VDLSGSSLRQMGGSWSVVKEELLSQGLARMRRSKELKA
jgi:hypothetical protein